MIVFNLPDLGEGLREAEIVAWHVAEGEHVVVDQPLLSVETEKAVVEIPSPRAGHIAKLFVRAGERVPVGAPLLAFEEGPHPESGTVVGELAQPTTAAPPAAAPAAAEVTARTPPLAAAVKVRAAPAVRALARELGVDLAQVQPTGPDGSITSADVEKAAAAAAQGTVLRGARRVMAANMARAGREVVPATLHDHADIEPWSKDADITVRLIRAVIAGCAAEPALNSHFEPENFLLRRNRQIDIGLAIDHPDGLFVPVLRNVGEGNPDRWREQIEAAKQGVQERSLKPADLRNPTITLSNFGTIAGRHAALVIVPPQVAILGAGRIQDIAVRVNGAVAMHRSLPLSLTFDHRAVTGGEAARFLRAVIADLEQPR
ncbi:MAG TPA: dihydrolipoamide acetyltransferase family protein [Xanthobacteraceae bacterium]|nr:dihydrolipoamide acetyltransferase family protein [Xanthobacteraceae bacterium]